MKARSITITRAKCSLSARAAGSAESVVASFNELIDALSPDTLAEQVHTPEFGFVRALGEAWSERRDDLAHLLALYDGEIRYTATFEVVPDFGPIDVTKLQFELEFQRELQKKRQADESRPGSPYV